MFTVCCTPSASASHLLSPVHHTGVRWLARCMLGFWQPSIMMRLPPPPAFFMMDHSTY